MRNRLRGLALAAALTATAPAGADILCLQDGRIFEGVELERDAGGVRIHFENGLVSVPQEKVLDCVILGDPGFVPETDEEREKLANGFVRYDGRWMKENQRDRLLEKRIEERKAEIERIKATSVWRSRHMETTSHFDFEATVPPHIFEYYRDLMETYFSEFLKAWKIKQPRDLGRLKVCFYVDRDNYLQVTGTSPNVLGYFRFVEPMELNIYYDRLDPLATEEVMFHEANHYLQKLIDPGFSYPHWPGESLAEYYGASKWDPEKKKLTSGLVLEGRLTEVQHDIAAGEMMSMERIITTDMYEDYTWGWTLVHFLMNHSKYEKKFKKFYVGLAKGKDVNRTKGSWNLDTVTGDEMLRAFKDYLGLKSDKDFADLEQEWHAYVKDELKVTSARGLEEAAFQARMRGRPIKAKRLYKEAIDAGSENAITYYRYADMLEDDNEYDEALKHVQRAIALDSLVPEFYILASRLMSREKGEDAKEESKRLLRLALEIDPDNEWLGRQVEELLKD